MERELSLLGCTAIEDKLQIKVPETIANLREAGIIIWVLTGDKIETAISIGFSCALLTSEMIRILVDADSTAGVEEQIEQAAADQAESDGVIYALVVSGPAITRIMNPSRGDLADKFLAIADCCSAVLACRVSPKQKADIVTFIRKKKPTARTLAIGDGANDVNMITSAHVGVGIAGLEG
jgi:phospholipid-transporting ATPase